jgi:hypothetical protein
LLTLSWCCICSPVTRSIAVAAATSRSTGDSGAPKILEAVPFVLAVLYYLFSPFFIGQARKGFIAYMEKADAEWQGDKALIPPHLKPKAVAANVDWIVDAPQMIPIILLPLAAAVFVLKGVASEVILAFATIVICVLTLWIYSCSPIEYRALRIVRHKYTLASALGIVLNMATAIVILTI